MVYKDAWRGKFAFSATSSISHHLQTGLTKACISSDHSHEWVEAKVLEYIKKWVPEERTAVLAGSSVHADRRVQLVLQFLAVPDRVAPFRSFLVEHMPSITDWLHYR